MHLEVFGKELGDAGASYLEDAPRGYISFDFWSNNMIDYDSLLMDPRGRTKATGPYDQGAYIDLWLEQFQIDKHWPSPKKSWKEWFKGM